MNLPVSVKVILRATLGPVFAVIALAKFNLFEYVTFIPAEYQYEVGLTVYLACAEALLEIIQRCGEKNCAKITCIFYRKANEINLSNIPAVSCSSSTAGCASIKCKIILDGSPKVLRKCQLRLVLPAWLSSQVEVNSGLLSYCDQILTLSFEKAIPVNNQRATYVEELITIPFILNEDDGILLNVLQPELVIPWHQKLKINCVTNRFQISNKEE